MRAWILAGTGVPLWLMAALGAYRDGPLPAMTGGFGEQTCRTCHFDAPLNARGGSLRIEGVPRAYAPGREYRITVVLRRLALARAGFEMTARFAGGRLHGQQAGRWRAADGRSQIVFAPGGTVEYIQHTKTGSAPLATGEGRWTILWTAPPAATGPIRFDAAANAANDDASPLGDFVYTASVSSAAPPALKARAAPQR